MLMMHMVQALWVKGAGTVKHFGLQDKIDFQIGTLSKAIGSWRLRSRN